MKIPRNCPRYGQMEIEIPDEDLIEVLYPLMKARLEEDYILTPKS